MMEVLKVAKKTLAELQASPRDYFVPAEVEGVLHMDQQTLRLWARDDYWRERLGFPVMVIGSRVKIPKVPFLRFMGVSI